MDMEADIYQVPNTNGDGLSSTEMDSTLENGTENIINEVKEVRECVPNPNVAVCLPNEATSTETVLNDSTEQYLIAMDATNDIVTTTATSVHEEPCAVSSEYIEEVSYSMETIEENIVRTHEDVHIESQIAIQDTVNSHEDSNIHVSTITEYNLITGEVNSTSDIDSTYDVTVENEINPTTAPSIDSLVATATNERIEKTIDEEICEEVPKEVPVKAIAPSIDSLVATATNERIEKTIDEEICEEAPKEVPVEAVGVAGCTEAVVDDIVSQTVEANEEMIVEEVEEVTVEEVDLHEVHGVDSVVMDEVSEEGYVLVKHNEPSVERSCEAGNVTECVIKEEMVTQHNVIEGTEISVSEAISLQPEDPPTLSHQDSIEKQLSQIVQGAEDPQSLSPPQQQSSGMSIAEAISRDFDESDDAEETSQQHQEQQLVVTEDDPHVAEQVVDIPDKLGHGPVTVTDNSGQVYFVESVEEVIVMENNVEIRDQQAEETSNEMELKMVDGEGYQDECNQEDTSNQQQSLVTPEVPPIPSHMLGRNIDNPVEDTFRNGKVPPKPRLGVKIPYKNLTSQIVSKDEIAREILERQRAKHGENKSNPANLLFTKKLTQRLAKKIAPTTSTKSSEKTIQDNSDLIAILEGNDDQPLRSVSSKRSLMTHVQEEQIVVIDKDLEREIALKQLSELPRRGRRRRQNYSGYSSAIENVTIPPRIKSKVEPKIEDKKVFIEKKIDEMRVSDADSTIEEKGVCAVQIIKEKEVAGGNMNKEKAVDEFVVKKTKDEEREVAKKIDDKSVKKIDEKKVGSKKNDEKIVEAKKVVCKKDDEKITETKKLEEKKVDGERSDKKNVEGANKKIDIKSIQVINSVDTTKVLESSNIDLESKPVATVASKPKPQTTAPIKTYERKRKSTEELPVSEKKIVRETPPTAYVTKSSRVIKKKVIWDPDEPSTAKYLADKVTSPQKAIKSVEEKKMPTQTPIKDDVKKQDSQKPIKSFTIAERVQPQRLRIPEKKPEKSPETPTKYKKRLSEVDKLLMDEGAVNMLYSVKNEESRKSLDKVQKDLRNITNEIKKDLTDSTERTSPKSLRKKDSPPPPPPNLKKISRKKSKDSNRSSVHSPPPSPSAFPNIADASRIIRRHSSSSFSSVEGSDDKDEAEKSVGKRKAAHNAAAAGKKRTRKDAEMDKEEKAKRNDENFMKLALEEVVDADFNFDYAKFTAYKSITVRQLDNLVQVVLKPAINEKAYLTLEVLTELTQLLEKLQKDSTCNVVVVSSSASSFCHGINYKSLCFEKEQTRKAAVKKLAMAVTGYLRALANFPKILVAGVHGECIGLGVTMLPLFDMVITCDNAMFSIPNAKLGCAAEGGSLLSLPHLMHNVLVSELLYASRKLAAAEALRLGMVTRVIWPNKFQQELINAVKVTSSHSLQFMHATKKQLRTRMKAQIEESLSGEVDTLLESWTSSECQKNFASYD